jgi:aryl-alcohol dehydrogenase-like predicted oxidoreductase
MHSDFSRTELAPGYSISRVILGLWQLSGGHGRVDEPKVLEGMRRMVEAGLTTFDCADIYTGVEELIGRFLKRYRPLIQSGELPEIQIHTKYVPDLEALPTLNRAYTEAVIDRSLRRLGVEFLDLVQFHWWDFAISGHVEAMWHLAEARKAGKIRHLAVTNYDAEHLLEILQAGVPVVSNQVQYSVLDRRPEMGLAALAQEYGFRMLCYGTVAGGFLSDRYLGSLDPREPFENRSLTKYYLIIEEFGGWEFFQDLLRALRCAADRHGVGIAEAAIRYVMQKSAVAGVIVGARSGEHLERLMRLEAFELDETDLSEIDSILRRSRGPVGPVFGLERDRAGKHGRIMRYDLNRIETEE